jgi:PAS domain S-box-containing protein
MSSGTLDRQIEAARRRLATLEEHARGSEDERAVAVEALEDLSSALEELHVAAEELRQQNEELASARELVEAERQRYQDLFEFAPDGYLVTDPEGVIREANAAAAVLLGVSSEFLVGKPLSLFVPQEDHTTLYERLTRLRAAPEPVADWQISLQPRERALFPASVTVGVVRDAARRLSGLRWLLRDVTDRRWAEEALRRAHDESEQKVEARTAELTQTVETLKAEVARRTLAEQALRERSEQLRLLAVDLTLAEQRERRRVADVLHGDLQQLLVAAKLIINPLEQEEDSTVRQVCREAKDLILQAITCSRSLTEELNPPILHRDDLVPALAWLARWMGEKHHLTVVVRPNGTARLETEATAVLLFQAVRELLFNAVKHAQVQTAQVELARQGDQLQIVVSDAGVGFDPSQLRVLGGTVGGLGLFSIRERLELLGGRIQIESAPGKGSRFTLWVPVQHETAVAQSAATSGTPPHLRNAGHLSA